MKPIIHFKHSKTFILLIFFSSIAILYLHNLTRDVYSGDIGDLVTAACVTGVAHPPGYPLFTFLGSILCQLPLPIPPVTKVALLSTFASLLGLILFYKFASFVTKNFFISLLSTSILGLSYLFWFHAEIPEVFGLNNLFAIAILYLAIRFYKEKQLKHLYLLVFLCGLSLTHHHTILFLFPGVVVLVFRHFKFVFHSLKRVLLLLLVFIFGLLPYLYVPLAASANPVINWNDASTLQNFMHLLLRKNYGGFATGIVNQVPEMVKLIVAREYLQTLITTFSYQIIFLYVCGIFALLKKDKLLLIALLTAFILSGPFFVYYAGNFYTSTAALGIIERFYSLSFIVFMFLVPFGLLLIKQLLDKRLSRKVFSYILLSYFLIVPLMQLYYNYPKNDLSQTRIGTTLVRDIFSYLPKNAVLFASGDTTLFNIWYVHYVLKERTDLGLINPPNVGGNVYLDNEINEYHAKNPSMPLDQVFTETIEKLRKEKPLYTTYELQNRPEDSFLLPLGLVYQIIDKKNVPDKQTYLVTVEAHFKNIKRVRRETLQLSESNLVASELPTIYSNAYVRIGDFVDSYYKDPALAEHYYRRALWHDTENPNAYSGLALAQYKGFKDCNGAIYSMNEAINIYPIWKTYYIQLYELYKRCDKNDVEKAQLADKYNDIFHEPIDPKQKPL